MSFVKSITCRHIVYLINFVVTIRWTTLNYETKNILPKDCPRWRTLKSRYNKVLAMCKLYNSIFLSVIEIERFLFLTMMNELEDTMSSGFNKTTWLSDSFERFFMDCMDIMTKVRRKSNLREHSHIFFCFLKKKTL